MSIHKVLAIVMAGGEGSRLYPLTAERSKPSVPFGGRYRIVDFVLSNLVNSGIHSIYLLVQYKSQSLIEHVRKAWGVPSSTFRHFVTIVPPQMRHGPDWFHGTADAVYQNRNLIYEHRPDVVAIFGADHIYRMDVNQMLEFHRERQAEATVAALPVGLEQAGDFGIIVAERDGRIRDFQEKPRSPAPMPDDPSRCYASMGNYLFDTEALLQSLEKAHERGDHDFGQHILPGLAREGRVFAYNFAENRIPGIKPYEEAAYWRDVGTLEAYFEAHRDLLGETPCFDEFNVAWPIHSGHYSGPVAKILGGEVENSLIGEGSLLKRARVRNSILRREVFLEPEVELEDCIVMDYARVGRGAKLRRVIVDRYNHIEPGAVIGYDEPQDRANYHVSPSGVVVLRRGARRLEPSYDED